MISAVIIAESVVGRGSLRTATMAQQLHVDARTGGFESFSSYKRCLKLFNHPADRIDLLTVFLHIQNFSFSFISFF